MSREAHPYAVLRGHQGDVQALTFDHSESHLISGYASIAISQPCYTITSIMYSTCVIHVI